MTEPLPFDPSEIVNWADRDDARNRLPELLFQLVMDTVSMPRFIEMPSGSSVNLPGWDGMLEVECGNAWVPRGISAWEFSCQKEGIKGKVTRDYDKRTGNPKGVDISTATFVFVTPRRWGGKREWVRERREGGPWADVRVWDADNLVEWLRQAPKASYWFGREIDRRLPFLEKRREALRAEHESNDTARQIAGLRADLSSMLSDAISQSESVKSEDISDPAHHQLVEQIDSARDLINRGLVVAARVQLERLQREAGAIPEALEFRIVTNLAVCAMAEAEVEFACDLLEQAHRSQPKNQTGIANASLAAQLRNDSKLAIELAHEALAIDPKDPRATTTLIGVLWETGQYERLEKFVAEEEWITRDPQCALALAVIRMHQSLFDEASMLCRYLIEADSTDAEAHLALSQCLLNFAQKDSLPATYGNDSLELLREAETEANVAIDLLESTQLKARRQEALVARAGTRILLGEINEAMRDLDTVLSETPTHPAAAHNKGLLLLKEGRPAEARTILESIKDSLAREAVLVPLADAYLELGEAAAVIELLKGPLNLDSPRWEEIRRAEILLRAEAKLKSEDSVGPHLEDALQREPENSRLLTLAAVRSSILEDNESAEKSLLEAIEYASSDSDRQAIQVQLGTLYEKEERFKEAAELFARSVGDDGSHPAAIPLLICLLNSGKRKEALDLARRIREFDSQPPRVVIEIEAQILEYVGDIHALVTRLEELCSRDDATSVDKVRLAFAQFRCGDHEEALETVRQINASELAHEPTSLLKLAQIKWILGLSDYLEDAYLSRRYGINNAEVHIGYFRLFQGRGDERDSPDTVDTGCAVRLKNDEGEEWWQILDDRDVSHGTHEIVSSHGLAQLLLGKRVGDIVLLRQDLEELSYEIIAIQSKFSRAFQETINEFSTRFPGNMALSRVRIVDDDFTKIFHTIDLRDQFVSNVESVYQSGQLPFGTFASIVGRSTLEIWRAYTKGSSSRIRFSTATDEELEHSDSILRKSDSVVLDMVALLTMHELGIAESLRDRFQRVVIPQQVFDELQNVIYASRIDTAPSGYMGKEEGERYALTDVSEDAWAEWMEYIDSVLKFAASFERIPSYPILFAGDAGPLVDAITEADVGAVYAGDEQSSTNQILVSDDLTLANVARGVGAGSVNTQAVLLELLRTQKISDEKYSEYIERLAVLNYWIVRVRSKEILLRLQENGYMTTPGPGSMLRTLAGPECPEDYAALVCADVITSLVGRALPQQIELLIPFVLSVLLQGRFTKRAQLKFRGEVASRLSPIERRWILQVVDLYI